MFARPALVSAATLHVWINSPSPAPPFATWATAATNIQQAVNAAATGDTVLVTNGVYSTSLPSDAGTGNRVVINKPIAVRSVNGPGSTWIVGAPDPLTTYGTGAVRCAFLSNGAVLDGFTLTNGHTGASDLAGRSRRGGGVHCDGNATLTNCVITGNRAENDGGGVYGGTLYRCVITGNSGGSNCDGGGADHSTLYNCFITNNHGRKGGGVDDSTLYGCVLTGNNGRVFGGGAARSLLYNCTVTDNYSRRGGGVSECEVFNSIVYHNRAAIGPNHASSYVLSSGNFDPNPKFYFSCTTPMPEFGSNNITLDPQLASWSHLSSASPCIGAASPAFAAGLQDIDGQPFVNPPSIGADEMVIGGAPQRLSVAIETDFTNVAVGYRARFEVRVDGEVTRTVWDFGDGTLVTNQLVVEHAYQTTGPRSVKLTGRKGGITITSTISVQVVAPPMTYVNAANSAPAFPYTSWATAATNIQSAIDASDVAGRVVLVTNGIYETGGLAVWGTMTNRAALNNGVTLRSVNGPKFTFIRGAPAFNATPGVGDGAIRCAYVGDGSVLDGFTLTNGFTRAAGHISREQGGGGAWCESRGVVTNCTFIGNLAARDGGGANGGIFYQCTFTGNEALEEGGAVDDAILHDCLIVSNVAIGGGGTSESVVHHSVLSGNTSTMIGGGGAAESTLRECQVIGNDSRFSAFGGGAWRSDLINSVVRGNRAQLGSGGAYNCTLMNCTVVGNEGSGVSQSRVRNSIIYHHALNTELSDLEFTCTFPSASGVGNITEAPHFVNLASGDLRLRPGSPGIDAGTNLSAHFSIDLDGNARPHDGDRNGTAAFDMGAYEFNGLYFTAITRSGNTLRVCWYETLPGMQLQSSDSVDAPVWATVPLVPGTNFLELPIVVGPRFFRLAR